MSRTITKVAVVLVAALGLVSAADAASAQPGPRVELFGIGTYETDRWGLTAVHAPVEGRPFAGAFSGGLLIDQRRFPDAGECLPADILFVVERGRQALDFIS